VSLLQHRIIRTARDMHPAIRRLLVTTLIAILLVVFLSQVHFGRIATASAVIALWMILNLRCWVCGRWGILGRCADCAAQR
jgi:hypothetical protein